MNDAELYRVVTDYAPVLIWISGPDKLRTYLNRRWLDFTGRPAESELGQGWLHGVHPDDRQPYLDSYFECFDRRQAFKLEYRLLRRDSQYRWMCDTGVPWFEKEGSFSGYIGTCFDITESKMSAEALARDKARLVEGLEEERTRIAREIHDDIGSSLAILGIELLRAGKPVSGTPGQRHPGVAQIYQKMQELASRVSRISHQLHPPLLEYLGLAKAAEKECREFSQKLGFPVSFSCSSIPAKLDPIVALSFFRVVQEALHNVFKHSQAARISVDLQASSSTITLRVSDDGVGFDVEESTLAPGIGMISMRERMRLIGGIFEVRSEPGKGADITCRAPLAPPETASSPQA